MKKKFLPSKIHLNQQGISKVLGELEASVMEVVWEQGDVTARQAKDSLQPQRELAFNTVMTVMNRLAKKGLLKKNSKKGACHFSATCTKNDFLSNISKTVLCSFLTDTNAFGAAFFSETLEKLDDATIVALRNFLDEYEK